MVIEALNMWGKTCASLTQCFITLTISLTKIKKLNVSENCRRRKKDPVEIMYWYLEVILNTKLHWVSIMGNMGILKISDLFGIIWEQVQDGKVPNL